MPEDILGEPSNFVGSTTAGGAYIGYRNPKRRTAHSGSGAGSSEFAAQDPRRLDLNNGPIRDAGDVPPGAEPQPPTPVTEVNIQTQDSTGNAQSASTSDDMRVRIRVPSKYLTTFTQGTGNAELGAAGFNGVIFPYTPQITLEHKAEYSSNTPLHSNYAINFYKSSSIPDITITGKFTVQNDIDAIIYLATVRLLSSLTKMNFGSDPDAGSPPPVCRLDAYGEYSLKNVPVVISSFKHDLPDDVDFYTLTGDSQPFGMVSVPTRTTLTVVCKPTYSRAEMQQASVGGYLNSQFKGKGYL